MRKKRNKRFLAIILACLMLFCVGCSEDILTGDDLDRAREAIAEKKWSLAERLLER